ncbi:MAG: hypothetical protein V8Q21_00400 [Akkermansia muciniphila]
MVLWPCCGHGWRKSFLLIGLLLCGASPLFSRAQDIASPGMPAADLDAFEKKAELEKASKAIFKYLLLDAACNQIAVRELKEREPAPGEEMIERRVLELMPQECLGECLAEFSRFMDLYRFRLRHGAAWEQKPEGKEMMEKFD